MISILIMLLLAGLFLWALGQLPLDATIVRLIRVVIIVVVVIYLIYFLVPLIPLPGGRLR